MTIKEFEQNHPNSPALSFLRAEPVIFLLIGILIFKFIFKLF